MQLEVMRRRLGLAAEVLRRDVGNRRRFGRHAPRFAQLVWVDVAACDEALDIFEPDRSGEVVGGDWERAARPLEGDWDVIACRAHFEDGVTWEETGVYGHVIAEIAALGGRKDGCETLDDVVRRYDALDRLFECVGREGRLRSRRELPRTSFREHGGILVHVGRDGRPIFGRQGCHRMAIARIQRLPVVPAQLGVVHPDALSPRHHTRQGWFITPESR